MNVRIIFKPDSPVVPGYIPHIDIPNPLKTSERLIPEVILDEEGRMFFDLPMHAAQRVLVQDEHLYKLWSPASLTVARYAQHGGFAQDVIKSVDPLAGKQKESAPSAPAGTGATRATGATRGRAAAAPAPVTVTGASAEEIADELADLGGKE